MHTENRITMRGDIDHIFAVASAVEAWPRLLPHYRWVTVLSGDTTERLVEMAAQRDGFPETPTDEKRSVTAVMRRVAQQLGNTPAVCRASYVSPAVVDQYLDGRTIADFRPRHLRVVGARQLDLDPEEQALLSLLRSWRIRQARTAA